jgi:hypothetical protein
MRTKLMMPRPPVGNATFRIGSQPFNLPLKFLGEQDVVTVQILNELAPCLKPAGFAGASRSFVGLMKDAELPGMAVLQRFCHPACFIRRTVVHDDDLDGAVRLRENAFDSPDQEDWTIVHGDDGADESLNHRFTPLNAQARPLTGPQGFPG